MSRVTVVDAEGRILSSCPDDKAHRLLASGRATLVSWDPFVIRLDRVVDLPSPPPTEKVDSPAGRRILLHICCAPCATYTVKRLREEGAQPTGYWFNPNIHPFGEHEKRRETLVRYAPAIDLPIVWEPGYEMPAFLQTVADEPALGVRCRACYRLRLERTAQAATLQGYDAFSTTLLISPYQNQRAIRELGEELATIYGVPFYFENFRQGFAEHHRLAQEYDLYRQHYCGCLYSEWEAWQHRTAQPRDDDGIAAEAHG